MDNVIFELKNVRKHTVSKECVKNDQQIKGVGRNILENVREKQFVVGKLAKNVNSVFFCSERRVKRQL